MSDTKQNILPKEKTVDHHFDICNISEYLSRISSCIRKRQQKDCVTVYRGEPDVYDHPCRPGIFRKDVLKGSRFFEKNLFDAMRQNKLTGEKRYLDNAIDAQHGEFPSRLLDVSYNCVVLGGNQIPIKSAAEAMRKTAEYILTQYPKVWDKLGESESKWITRDENVSRQRKGHFRSLSGEIQAGEFTCWIGTHSSTPLKLQQIEKLCRLAEVHKDEIFWYVESSRAPLFRW